MAFPLLENCSEGKASSYITLKCLYINLQELRSTFVQQLCYVDYWDYWLPNRAEFCACVAVWVWTYSLCMCMSFMFYRQNIFIKLTACFPCRCHHWMRFPFIIWNLTVLWSFDAWFRICLTLSFTWQFMKRLTETQKHVYVLLFSIDFLFIISGFNFVLVLSMVVLIQVDW